MGYSKMKEAAQIILDVAGVKIDGKNPWDLKVHNDDFYRRVFSYGSLGLGESYMDGDWGAEKLDEFFFKVLDSNLDKKLRGKGILLNALKAKLLNFQTKKRSLEVGKRHYDLGNGLYSNMLDSRMIYTCGYWKDADNLEDAQKSKLELTCEKIGLKPKMSVLDIGCGWGGFAKFAAQEYGAEVLGVTISKEQAELAKENVVGLPVEIRMQDYRDVSEKFDRIVSLGMFEHVGSKNYETYMKKASECLKDDGLFLLHTIGKNHSGIVGEPWMGKYIFPNSILPSAKQIMESSEGKFVMEDWHNFGADYDKTLMAWNENFQANWDEIKKTGEYDERFKRMWEYYLLSCAGSFRARSNQLWQIVFSKDGVEGGYSSVR